MSLRPPMIQSPALRGTVVAALMLAMFTGSVLLAYTTTGAPLRSEAPEPPNEISLGGLVLALPSAWAVESHAEGTANSPAAWTLVNAASPAERLRVFRFTASQPVEPRQLMSKLVLPQLVAGRRLLMTPDAPALRFLQQDAEAGIGETLEIIFSTQRLTSAATSPQLHAVTLYTPDRQSFWVFQLTDQVSVEQWNRNLELGHLEQLRRLTAGISPEPLKPPGKPEG